MSINLSVSILFVLAAGLAVLVVLRCLGILSGSEFAKALPKTRSGKIMRRILRKIAENATDQLGDISTLADPSVVEVLVKGRQ